MTDNARDLARRASWSLERAQGWLEAVRDSGFGCLRNERSPPHFTESLLDAEERRRLGYWEGASWAVRREAPGLGWEEAGEEELASEASHRGDALAPEALKESTFRYDAAFPVDALLGIMTREQWTSWLAEESRASCGDGRPGYGFLVAEDIEEPVVILDDGESLDILDGWHRAAATVVKGAASVPAIVCGLGRKAEPDGLTWPR